MGHSHILLTFSVCLLHLALGVILCGDGHAQSDFSLINDQQLRGDEA